MNQYMQNSYQNPWKVLSANVNVSYYSGRSLPVDPTSNDVIKWKFNLIIANNISIYKGYE